jgi:TPP-dependent indolepyruvate ferredoxin oxidoreductase alpha subunit
MCYPEIHTLGNVFAEDMQAIWNGPAYQQLRAQLRSDSPPAFCKGCPYDVSWMSTLKHKPRGQELLK